MRILITGGAGFIGSALVERILDERVHEVLNLDALTYAANRDVARWDRLGYRFIKTDICDPGGVQEAISGFAPEAIVHLAAESHVDRSIDGPRAFLETNVMGTLNMLQRALDWWRQLEHDRKENFRFIHVSTDEVYGDLEPDGAPFTETHPYAPSNPYSASKAASDHLARAWHRTYGLPVIVANCSNTYGPRQFPEKLIPLMILNALQGRALPVYGDGMQVRDWLHVEDNAEALHAILTRGKVGNTYNVGGGGERANIETIRMICAILEEERPIKPGGVTRYVDLVTHVRDRPGHDRRYAINGDKIAGELGWRPSRSFEEGLRATVRWYIQNLDWCERMRTHDA